MNAGGARFNHRLHQLMGVEHATEACLGVCDDRRHEIDLRGLVVVEAFHVLDLVGTHQGIVDALDHRGH